jgi:hypothetical protein
MTSTDGFSALQKIICYETKTVNKKYKQTYKNFIIEKEIN